MICVASVGTRNAPTLHGCTELSHPTMDPDPYSKSEFFFFSISKKKKQIQIYRREIQVKSAISPKTTQTLTRKLEFLFFHVGNPEKVHFVETFLTIVDVKIRVWITLTGRVRVRIGLWLR